MRTLAERLKQFDLLTPSTETSDIMTSPEVVSLCEVLTESLSQKIAAIPIWFDYSEEEQKALIFNFLNKKLDENFSEIRLAAKEKERISSVFFNSVFGFGSLDFLFAKKSVSKVIVNSPDDVYCEENGEIIKLDLHLEKRQFDALISRMVETSRKNSPVITFRFKNLLVTILRQPVCAPKLILKKVESECFNFKYFENKGVLDAEISNFFRYLLNNKKKILISSGLQSGKTAFLNAFINEVSTRSRILLFEQGALINTENSSVNRFDIEGLSFKEQQELITAALYYNPEYIFSDINDIEFNLEIFENLFNNSGFICSIRANTPLEAMTYFTSVQISKQKCTEKLAKIQFAKDIDYIIQLEKTVDGIVVKSIVEVSNNKAGTPVFEELLAFKSGKYIYDFKTNEDVLITEEELGEQENLEEVSGKKCVRPQSFSSRLK